jgi:hypothetical protein
MKRITGVVTVVFAVGGLAVLGAAQRDQALRPPEMREQNRPVPPEPQSPKRSRRVVCGMTVISPGDRTDYKIREFTPAPNAPRFVIQTPPTVPCERTVAPPVPEAVLPLPPRDPRQRR